MRARRQLFLGPFGGTILSTALLVAASCTSAPSPRSAGSTDELGVGIGLPSEVVDTRRLYRAEYDGPEGGGILRLTLRIHGEDSYSLAAADRLGRQLWTLVTDVDRVLWIDHRGRRFCRRAPSVVLPGLETSGDQLPLLPALLLGELPAPTPWRDEESVEGELLDRDGRRWTVRRDTAGAVVSWTLWDAEGPVWWWQREGRGGGILSQRTEGRQLSWRETVSEVGAGDVDLAAPPGYVEVCDEGP